MAHHFSSNNPPLRRPLRSRSLLQAAILALAALAGCQTNQAPPPGPRPLDPLEPDAALHARTDLPPCREPQRGPTQILLTYAHNARDFRGDDAPDGYVIRVVPLDRDYDSVPVKGRIIAALYPDPATDEPLRTWQVAGEDLDACWLESHLIPGYLLALDWGTQPPPPGAYRLRVWLIPHNAQYALCREIAFVETLPELPQSAKKLDHLPTEKEV